MVNCGRISKFRCCGSNSLTEVYLKTDMIGAIKIERTAKTKFRKNNDGNREQQNKQKHHDRSFYRLMKEEQEYANDPKNSKRDTRD